MRAGDEGTVLVRAEIDASGKPSNVELAKRSRSRDLDRAALAAVRNWTFEPAIRDGKAVASTVQVPSVVVEQERPPSGQTIPCQEEAKGQP